MRLALWEPSLREQNDEHERECHATQVQWW
jgi:hypothetical protein